MKKSEGMSKRFQRRKEDFVCGKCGKEVEGDGFTNHCPYCLWSRHVDIFPGDRKAKCGGLMAPVALDQENGMWKLTHQCLVCGHQKRNKSDDEDDFEVILVLAKTLAKKRSKKQK